MTDSYDSHPFSEEGIPQVRSLRELIDLASGKSVQPPEVQEQAGLAEPLPFPFLALVGQMEMKIALLIALINPGIGGVLLVGPRGTGKTTAVRSLLNLLPEVSRSACFYGCLTEDIETGGMDAVCPDCAKKYGQGLPLEVVEPVRLVELPLNARMEDVVGGLDERAALHERLRLRRGILAHADQNILYVDEVNLLEDQIVDSILDAAAQGSYTVRRGTVSATYHSRFTLIGSMNPEEGALRPQIMDRFGLRVMVRGLEENEERMEAYRRVRAYMANPRQMVMAYSLETEVARQEIIAARELLPRVDVPQPLAARAIDLIKHLEVDSLRAEIALLEGARAYAAADGRDHVCPEDIRVIAPLALRMRRSEFMINFFKERQSEDRDLNARLDAILPEG